MSLIKLNGFEFKQFTFKYLTG